MPMPRRAFIASFMLICTALVSTSATAQLRRSSDVTSIRRPTRGSDIEHVSQGHTVHVIAIDAATGAGLRPQGLSVFEQQSTRPLRYDRLRSRYSFRTTNAKFSLIVEHAGVRSALEISADRRSPLTRIELQLHEDGHVDARTTGLTHTVSEPRDATPPSAGAADRCFDATAITGSGVFEFQTLNATTDGPLHDPCNLFGTAGFDHDVWFAWTSDCNGPVTVSTCNRTEVDTRLGVYDGDRCPPDARSLLACNDDACGNQSSVTFNASFNAVYLIRIGVFPGEPAGGGNVEIATSCDNSSLGADSCDEPTPISGAGTFAFNNQDATADGPAHAACASNDTDAMDRDVWFCWTADTSGPVSLTLCGQTTIDTRVAVYDGCGCSTTGSTLIACDDDACGLQSSVSFDALQGRQYAIRIGVFPGSNGGTGTFTIASTANADGFGGDTCADAVRISGEGLFTFDNRHASSSTLEPMACMYFGSGRIDQDVWFLWTADVDGVIEASTCGLTVLDTRLAVYSGERCPDRNREPLGCNDDTCGLQSAVRFNAISGRTYLLQIGSFPGAGTGTGRMSLRRVEASSECCEAQPGGQPGCADASCQEQVCGADTFCCDVSWDQLCATQAMAWCGTCDTSPATGDCTSAEGCQMPDQTGHGGQRTLAVTSDDANQLTAADGFKTLGADVITTVCFWGCALESTCAPSGLETFTITYFRDDASRRGPGSTLAGPFDVTCRANRTGNSIETATGSVDTYRYQAHHDAVAVDADTCYWIQIVNTARPECMWRWLTAPAGDGRSAVQNAPGNDWTATDFDLAFCLDIPFDDRGCERVFACEDDDPDAGSCCTPHDGPGCEVADCCQIACAADPFCCDATWDARCAETAAELCVDVCSAEPDNDRCASATMVAIPSLTDDTTTRARPAETVTDCRTAGPGLWYTVIGTGSQLSASLCPPQDVAACCIEATDAGCDSVNCERLVCRADPFCCATAWDAGCVDRARQLCDEACPTGQFDAKLTIFAGGCEDQACVATNDDTCGVLPHVTWFAEAGVQYEILVHGYAGATGAFELAVEDEGSAR